MKVLNKQLNKANYFTNQDMYWRVKFINRKFGKQASKAGYSTKLSTVYEKMVYS